MTPSVVYQLIVIQIHKENRDIFTLRTQMMFKSVMQIAPIPQSRQRISPRLMLIQVSIRSSVKTSPAVRKS